MTPNAIPNWKLLLIILMGGVAIRCVGIAQPFADTWSWRQADVAMIAEHFYHNGFHLFYPEVNWGGPPHGDIRGYVGTELPIMPWLAALFYTITGEHEWVGRSLSVLAWAVSLPALFLYIRRLVNVRTALFACLFYALMPLSIYTSRSFMPDMPSLAAALWALLLFDLWLDRRGNLLLLVGTIAAIALAILVKPPSIMIGVPMLIRALQKSGVKIFLDPRLWLIAILSIIPAYFWFKHAAWLGHTFFPYHLFGEEGFRLERLSFYLERLWDMSLNGMTPVAVPLAIFGMVIAARDRRLWPFYGWFAAWAVFFVIAGHGNRHQWYQLPLVPVIALFGAVCVVWLYVQIGVRHAFLARVAAFSLTAAVACTALFGIANYSPLTSTRAMNAGLAMARLDPEKAPILVANDGDPIVFYYAHLYGWHFHHAADKGLYQGLPADGHEADFAADIRQGRADGAAFFVLSCPDFWWLDYYKAFAAELAQYRVLEQTPDYKIYDLRKPIAP